MTRRSVRQYPPLRNVCPNCQDEAITGVEYCLTPQDFDGVSEWRCNKCQTRWGRWTGRILADGELEPRYGAKP